MSRDPDDSPFSSQLRVAHLAILPRHWHSHPHLHAYNEIVIPTSGRVETTLSGKVEVAAPGELLLYPAGATHCSKALEGKPLTLIVVGWDGDPGVSFPLDLARVRDATGRVTVLARWLLEFYPSDDPRLRELGRALIKAMLFEISQNLETPVSNLTSVVRRYVKAHLADPLSISDLARAVGLSPFHFSRVFKDAEGVPPMTFVRNARIEAARTLLETTQLNLREVAESVGFSDQFQLSRIFRRVLGIAPSDVRETQRRPSKRGAKRRPADRS